MNQRSLMQHILLVEDDKSLAQWVQDYLQARGYRVSLCDRGDLAATKINAEKPDLVLLDGMLPGLDGFDVCKAIRPHYNGPIIMLTARDEEIDEVLGLELGADDYLTKPVKPRVLLARIQLALRRCAKMKTAETLDRVCLAGLVIDQSARTVSLNEKLVKLSSHEFDLLWLLAQQAGQVVNREQLVEALRGFEYDGLDRSIDLRVSRLRKKLGDNSTEPYRIKTVWGKGYMLVKDAW